MAVLADTSALYAILNRGDAHHEQALSFAASTAPGDVVTHSYVAVETASLAHRRLGFGHVRVLLEDLLPALGMRWVTEEVHRAAVSAMLGTTWRSISLVDWVSFEVMRRDGITTAFAFDEDFVRQGFETVP